MARTARRQLSVPVLVAAGASSLVLALGMSPTFSAFSASISNSINQAATGTLVMQELNSAGTISCLSTDAGGVSSNVASCASINKYGGDLGMLAGDSSVTQLYIKNAGTLQAQEFSFTPGACSQSANGTVTGGAADLCSKIQVTIVSGSATVFSGTAQTLGAAGRIDLLSALGVASIPAGAQTGFTITATVDSSVGNTYQGLKISQPMTWAFGS